MKTIAKVILAAAVAAAPLYAANAKKMTKEEAEAAELAKQRDNSWRLVRDSVPLVLPSWSLPIFFGMHMDQKLKGNDKKK